MGEQNRVRKAKILILFFFIVLGIVGLASNDRLLRPVESNAGGPPAAVTAAPGEQACIACHDSNPATGTFAIIAPTTYLPGQTYQITVRHINQNSSRKRWGFELTALSGSGAAGTFGNLSSFTQTLSQSNRNYIEHNVLGTFQNQTGGAQWTFNWTAPATNVGTVTLYAAGNQANSDGTEFGDQIYTTTSTVDFGGATPTPTPASMVPISVDTSPTGRAFVVDNTTYTSAQSFNWVSGSLHTISTTTPQQTVGATYTWSSWSDSGAIAHDVSPSVATNYVANFTVTPTGALVTVSGRIMTSSLIGLRNATVAMTDSNNVVRTATTSSFGFFSFGKVATGQQYSFRVQSRLFRYSPVVATINDEITLPDFVGLE